MNIQSAYTVCPTGWTFDIYSSGSTWPYSSHLKEQENAGSVFTPVYSALILNFCGYAALAMVCWYILILIDTKDGLVSEIGEPVTLLKLLKLAKLLEPLHLVELVTL